jgi:hypothetical protein
MKTMVTLSFLVLSLFFGGVPWASAGTLSITEMKVEPAVAQPGGKVLLSCRAKDSRGPMFVERVAASARSGDRGIAYPMLFDDATHGDKARDGVYSLEITAPETAGEFKITFHAVASDKQEYESEAVTLMVR